MKEAIVQGRTIEEAVEAGRIQLGCEREDMMYEVLEIPKKGFLGFGNIPAKVRVYRELGREENGVEYLKNILEGMGIFNYQLDVKKQDNTMLITIEGEKLGAIIGRRGETLDALQYLVSLIVNQGEGSYLRVTLDSGSYREKREKTLQALAHKIAQGAVKSGRSTTLEPMNPYERRIIHAAVLEVPGATSSSVGEEPNRRVVISSTEKKPFVEKRGFSPRGKKPPYRGEGRPTERKPYEGRKPAYKAEEKKVILPVATTEVQEGLKAQEKSEGSLYTKIEI